MDNGVKLLKTKEEALAAGVPEDVFNPSVHLYSSTIELVRPTAPTEVADVGGTDGQAE